MFNNRFNSTKKDPLVEAVQSAMQDGEIRRQAEALVNEEFGVYSRKAVVREHLAAYDARLEEAYKCMKEDEKKIKVKLNPEKEVGYTVHDVGPGGKKTLVKSGKDKVKDIKEAKKLADKDYDKDGKIESPKDEVWGSRFRAAKMAGKMDEEQIDELYGKGALGKIAAGHAKAYKKAQKDDKTEVSTDQRGRTYTSKLDTKGHSATRYHQLSGDRATLLRRKAEGKKTNSDQLATIRQNAKGLKNQMDEEQIDEISKGLARKYKSKAHASFNYATGKRDDDYFYATTGKKMKDLEGRPKFKERSKEAQKADDKTIQKRLKGLSMAHKKLAKEETDYSAPDRAAVTRDNKPSTPAQTNAATSGPSAADKAALTSKIKTMKEAVYSAKAARAGKDIGKPGKEFKKIAKSAAERYGSEERGKKVAGAILKRIRAKHMKEENLEELSAFGRAFAAAKGQNFTFGGKQYSGAMKGQTGSSSAPRPSVTSAPRTNTPGTQGVATGKSFAAIDKATAKADKATPKVTTPSTPSAGAARDVGLTGKAGGETGINTSSGAFGNPDKTGFNARTVSLDRPGNVGARPAGAGAAGTVTGGAPTPAPAPATSPEQSRAAPGTFAARSAAGEMKADSASAGVKKLMSMNESVQVGDNKYRIV
jgi:hypothetical protein